MSSKPNCIRLKNATITRLRGLTILITYGAKQNNRSTDRELVTCAPLTTFTRHLFMKFVVKSVDKLTIRISAFDGSFIDTISITNTGDTFFTPTCSHGNWAHIYECLYLQKKMKSIHFTDKFQLQFFAVHFSVILMRFKYSFPRYFPILHNFSFNLLHLRNIKVTPDYNQVYLLYPICTKI